MGGMLLMCQNTTMRVYGARIQIYWVLCSKRYSSSSSLVITSRWFATSRLVTPVSVRLLYSSLVATCKHFWTTLLPHSTTRALKGWGHLKKRVWALKSQNILPIHWKMCISFTGANLWALRFKSSYAFLKCPQITQEMYWNVQDSVRKFWSIERNSVMCWYSHISYKVNMDISCMSTPSQETPHHEYFTLKYGMLITILNREIGLSRDIHPVGEIIQVWL